MNGTKTNEKEKKSSRESIKIKQKWNKNKMNIK